MKDNENNNQQNEIIEEELFEEQTKSYSLVSLFAMLIVAIGLMAGSWYVYNSYKKKNYDEVIIVSADQDEIKVQPSDPGGMIVNNMDKDIYDAIDNNKKAVEKAEILLPPSEEPINKKDLLLAETSLAIKKLEETPPPSSAAVNVEPPKIEIEAPQIASQTEPEEVHTSAPFATKELSTSLTIPPIMPAELDPPKTAPEQKVVVLSPKKTEEYIKPITKKETKNKPQFAKKIDKSYRVQVASLKSVIEAEREWKNMSKRFKILSNYQHYIVSKDIADKGTFQRLQVGPFENEKAAKKACSQFKELGISCFIINP